MSYVRRQRLSWARIKLSCFWYLYLVFWQVQICFYKRLNLTYFFGRLLYRFFTGLTQRFIVYFSMYFLRSTLCRTTLILPSVLGFVNTFLKLFYFIFLCFLPLQKGIKKLVIFPSASHIFLLKYITNPSFFICFSFGLLGTFLYYHFSSFMSILFFNFFSTFFENFFETFYRLGF